MWVNYSWSFFFFGTRVLWYLENILTYLWHTCVKMNGQIINLYKRWMKACKYIYIYFEWKTHLVFHKKQQKDEITYLPMKLKTLDRTLIGLKIPFDSIKMNKIKLNGQQLYVYLLKYIASMICWMCMGIN